MTASGLGLATFGAATPAAALGNGLALTPPMGWNSWNAFGTNVTEQQVKNIIDYMSANGLVQAGYDTVTIDDGWSAAARDGDQIKSDGSIYDSSGRYPLKTSSSDHRRQLYDANNNPVPGTDGTGNDLSSGHLVPRYDPNDPNSATNFPDGKGWIAALASYAHSKNMKFGLYSTSTYLTCQGHPGSLGHEDTDATDFVSWGVDYVKYDSCPVWSGPDIPVGSETTHGEGKELGQSMYARVQAFQQALDRAAAAQGKHKVTVSVSAQPNHYGSKSILQSVNPGDPAFSDPVIDYTDNQNSVYQYRAPGFSPTGVWCGQVAHLCRTGGDRSAGDYNGIMNQLDQSLAYPENVRPTSWNDMDMMWAGYQGGSGGSKVSDDQSRTEMSVYSMMASPLISGVDLTGIDSNSLGIYKKQDVINVDQDPLGVPATQVADSEVTATGSTRVLKRPLANGDTAVLFINGDDPASSQGKYVSVNLAALNVPNTTSVPTELWDAQHANTYIQNNQLSAYVNAHGVAMYRIGNSGNSGYFGITNNRTGGSSPGSGVASTAVRAALNCSQPTDLAVLDTWNSTYTSEQWKATPNSDGTVSFTDNCTYSGQTPGTLTDPGSAGAQVKVLPLDPNNNSQKWRIVTHKNGLLTLTNVASGNVLDSAPDANANAQVVVNPANSSSSTQSWTFQS
ncbi:RICIN domain-containing protein [Streptomyces sp. NPDC052396]|uniref:RICIN domain-containing protein n=1 Tax=Streptomyces sp. NPDC052396 TaxID=3365689 RepID=UPI0037D8776B